MSNLPATGMEQFKAIDALAGSIAKSDAVGNEASTEALFVGRLQLVQPLSKVTKAEGAKCSPGDFVYGPPGFVNFGRAFYAVPIAWRDHALQLKNASEVSMESFSAPPKGSPPKDQHQESFLKIANAPKQQNGTDKGKQVQYTNMYGKDVLWWMPTIGKFATYFFHSTARPESENAYNRRGTLCKCSSNLIETKSFSWWTPQVENSDSLPANIGDKMFINIEGKEIEFILPSTPETKEEMEKFFNPSPHGVEITAPDGRPR